MSKHSQLSPQELKKLETAVAAAQTKLSHLQREIATSEARSKELADNLADTKNLEVEKLKNEATEARRVHDALMHSLDSEEDKRLAEIADRSLELAKLKTDITTANGEISQLRSNYKELNAKITSKTTELEDLNVKLSGANQALAAAQNANAELDAELSAKQQESFKVSAQLKQISAELTQKQAQYDSFKTEAEANAQRLRNQKAALENEIIEISNHERIVREDLAARTLALDERDEVLKRREIKVATNEAKIRRNSSLLKL